MTSRRVVAPAPPSLARARRAAVAGLLVTLALAASSAVAFAQTSSKPDAPRILVTSDDQRESYMARANIWQERRPPSPRALVDGPPMTAAGDRVVAGVGGASRTALNPPAGIPCAFETKGDDMGGKTPKFTCKTPGGQSIRVKYFSGDPDQGNREVFAEVVTTRLFWALGFHVDAVYPITVSCQDCPEDPMKGTGHRAARRYLGVTEARFEGALILSKRDTDQGWKFGEVEDAIGETPAGTPRMRQQAHFDALRLLAAFVQHGDRKAENQRLACLGALDLAAGEVRSLQEREDDQDDEEEDDDEDDDEDDGPGPPALFEREGAVACRRPVLMIQDLGATFGSSGKMTSKSDKLHLESWAKRGVFERPDEGAGEKSETCKVDVTVAFTAGGNAKASAPVSEAGRQLLARQLARLTDAHIRALFEAGRVEAMDEEMEWTDPATKRTYSGVGAWVAAFKHKRAEIVNARCGK